MTKYAGRDLVLSIVAPSLTATGVASTDLVTTGSAHGFAAGDAIAFPTLVGGTATVVNKRYYVIAAGLTTTVFAFSATAGGSAFNFTSDMTAGTTVAKFNSVGQVTSLGEAGSSRDLIDASAYGDSWKDYVVGQQDGSELDVEVAYDPVSTGHIAVKTAYDAGTATLFGMRHVASGFDIAYPALVTKFTRGGERDGLMKASATLKILNPGVTDTP